LWCVVSNANFELIAGDCFELGRQLYNNNDYKHAESWFREAIKKERKESKKTVSRQQVMEYLEFSLFKLGSTVF
jgi:prolyl 4-hydroxylase